MNPFIDFLWKYRKNNIIALIFIAILSIVIAFFVMDKYYTSDVSILPPAGGGDLGKMNTIASIMGMGNMGGGLVSLEMYESIILSRKLQEKLLATSVGDNANSDESVSNQSLLEYLKIEGDNEYEIQEKAHKELNEEILYTEYDDISNILNLQVALKDPFIASNIANKIVMLLDEIVKDHLTKEFHEQYNYIEKRKNVVKDSIKLVESDLENFLKTSIDLSAPDEIVERMRLERTLTIQTAIYAEIKTQEELFLMKNAYMLSPVKVLDSGQIPYKKSRPKRIIVVIALIIIGGFILFLINSSIVFYRRFRTEIVPKLNSGANE